MLARRADRGITPGLYGTQHAAIQPRVTARRDRRIHDLAVGPDRERDDHIGLIQSVVDQVGLELRLDGGTASGVAVGATAAVARPSALAVGGVARGAAATATAVGAAFFASLAALSSFGTEAAADPGPATGVRVFATLLSMITLYGDRAWRLTHSGSLLSSTVGGAAAACASAPVLISTPTVQTSHRWRGSMFCSAAC